MKKRIVIVGGGFGGVKCARALRKHLTPDQADIVVFNRENHMVFHPLLAEVVSGSVQAKDVAAPIRQLLSHVQCRSQDVTNIDPDTKKVFYEAFDMKPHSMEYDHLVLCCGNIVNLSLIEGMDDHAFPLKTVGDAFKLQSQIIEQMEEAEVCDCGERRKALLTFVVVGGGFSGVEVAGEINDLVRDSIRFYTNIHESDIKVIIVHSHKQLLPEISEHLRVFAQERMEKAGVTIMLNASAKMATPEGLHLKDGTFIRANTVVCTIGTTTQPLIEKLSFKKEHGRLVTETDMSLPGYPNVWAFGDCAAVINAQDGKVSPPLAQFSERQGAQAAKNIIARMNNQPTLPFKYEMQGVLCAIGGRDAVADIRGIRLSGLLAWFVWRGIYLLKLPSFTQQVKVGIEWGLDLMFPRPLAHLKADQTTRITRSRYAEGDFVFKRGEPATEFYIVEEGEVEVIQHESDNHGETIAVMGKGEFFGESSLLDRRTHNHSIRCKTAVTCTVFGRHIFTQVSAALMPLRTALAKASRNRSSIWKEIPDVKDVLELATAGSLMEPLLMAPVNTSASVETVCQGMDAHGADLCCVVDEQQHLVGVITRSDLLRVIDKPAFADPDVDVPVTEIMVLKPVFAAQECTLAAAVALMRDHDLKQIPIVDSKDNKTPRGRLNIEKVVVYMLKESMQRKQKQPSAVAH